jgi:hypothetical protein
MNLWTNLTNIIAREFYISWYEKTMKYETDMKL